MLVPSEDEPVNLLACDGGGIRGVSELVILDEVMRRVQQKGDLIRFPKPCDYFHLIGGTSTGGLVAIMLGRLEMSTEEALAAYDSFASKIFSKANKNTFKPTEKYKADTLGETVQKLVEDQNKEPLMRDSRPDYAKGRAFVCTMPLKDRNTTVRLRTYHVEGDKYSNCLIYEAARATTAASVYFKPMKLKDVQGKEQDLVDAAIGRNNPISVMPGEAISLFGAQRRLGCVVSLGTGSRKQELVQAKAIIEMPRQIISLLKVMKECTTDTRKDHEQMESKFKNFSGVYFRFDVDGGAEGISLDEWKKIGELRRRTQAFLRKKDVSAEIDRLAEALLNGNQHGLNLAHLGGLDKNAIIRNTQVLKPRGRASTIFTGQDNILGKIRTTFMRHEFGDISRREFHLWGMGGVGKTQIALKFAEEFEQKSNQIFWIDATSSVTMEQSYHRIAERLLSADQQGSGAIQKVLAMLEASDDWLLVFDNAPDRGLAHYMPGGNRGNIFYTSRHKHLERRMPPGCDFNVDKMGIEDAVTLLLRSARMDADDITHRDAAKPIAEELGCLPLALDQAGAYMNMAPCPLEQFLDRFNAQKETLLRDPEFRGEDNSRNLPVYTTFNISYEAIKAFANKRSDPQRALKATYALQLLKLVCFYHNEGCLAYMFNGAAMDRFLHGRSSDHPLKADGDSLEHFVLISQDAEQEGHEWQSQNFRLGMSFLEEFSLIGYEPESMDSNMHVLIHDWARARMAKQQRTEWGLAARSILLDSMDGHNSRELIMLRRNLLPHLESCMSLVKGCDDDLRLEAFYQGRIAKTYEEADRVEDAGAARMKAVIYAKRSFGFLDENMLDRLSVQARFYKRHGFEVRAEAVWLEVIDRRILRYDEEKWRMAKAYSKKRTSANPQELVDVANQSEGDALDDIKLRDDKMALAALYIDQCCWAAAEKHIHDIFEWDRRRSKSPEDDEDTHVTRARDLARQISGEKATPTTIPEAQCDYLEAVETFGPNDRLTFKKRTALARCLLKADMPKDAEVHFQEILEWRKQTHGTTASDTLEVWLELADAIRAQLRPIEAMGIEQKVLWAYREKFGAMHPKTMECQRMLAFSLFLAGFFELSLYYCNDSLKICTSRYGPEHQRTRVAAYTLRLFQETFQTMPLHMRLHTMQECIQKSKVALEGDPRMPPWLAEWEPKHIEPLLTAEGTQVGYENVTIMAEEGQISSWRQVDEAVTTQTQTLEMIVPPALAKLCIFDESVECQESQWDEVLAG